MSDPPLSFNAWLRFDIVSSLLDRLEPSSILEIGPGQGAVGVRLASRCAYMAVEPDTQSFEVARQRLDSFPEAHIINSSDTEISEHTEFDMVCAFEVLEHIADDDEALARWKNHVSLGGHLLLSVPAYQRRFSAADRMAGHYRRYDPDDISAKLRQIGFSPVVVLMYGGPLGFVLEAARNVLASFREAPSSYSEATHASGRWFQPLGWLGWATKILTGPFRLAQIPFLRSNFGTGLVVLARKPPIPEDQMFQDRPPSAGSFPF